MTYLSQERHSLLLDIHVQILHMSSIILKSCFSVLKISKIQKYYGYWSIEI